MSDNWPSEAITTIQRVLDENAEKYEPGHWRAINEWDHASHALTHLECLIEHKSPFDEDHLAHALCRLAFVVSVREANK